MSHSKNKIQTYPKVIFPGGIIKIDFEKDIDPFDYEAHRFLLNDTPLRFITLTNNSFTGCVKELDKNLSYLQYFYKNDLVSETSIYTPEPSFIAKDSFGGKCVIDSHFNLYLLYQSKLLGDPKNSSIYIFNLISKSKDIALIPHKNISAIAIHNDELYFTSASTRSLYKLNEQRESVLISEGLGIVDGLISFQNNIIVGEQNGSIFKINEDHQAIFLTEIMPSLKNYYFAIADNKDIYISIPSHYGKNRILILNLKHQLSTFIETFNIVGDIAFSNDKTFYWIEHTRTESVIYRKYKTKKTEKFATGSNLQSLSFDPDGNLYVNNTTHIYKIKKEALQ